MNLSGNSGNNRNSGNNTYPEMNVPDFIEKPRNFMENTLPSQKI